MNKTVLAVLAGVLVGGGAIAAYQQFSTPYAEVVSSTPITEKEPIYGDVISATAVTEMRTGSRQVCEDVAVEKRRPERFGNKDGAVIGAVAGALIGSQVGGGDGKKLATVAGAVGGGLAGREIDRRHVGGERYTEIEQQCRTVTEPRRLVMSPLSSMLTCIPRGSGSPSVDATLSSIVALATYTSQSIRDYSVTGD